MSHRNARLTVHGRRLIVERFEAGWKQAHIAAAMGVSRKCVRTWIDRYASEGEDGLENRSSRPHTTPTRTSAEVEAKILTARSADRCGPDVLGPRIGVPARTVSRVLRRHGVPMAIATDCNPGTSPVLSATLMLSMACTLFGLTPEEALAGMTRNAAKALGREAELGTIASGKAADLCVWRIGRPAELAYWIGHPGPERRYVGGVEA